MVTRITACLFFLFLASALMAQDRNANSYIQQGLADHQQQNYDGFLENFRKAYELRPQSPAIRYNLACGMALNQKNDSALMLLESLAEQGIDFNAANDNDFKALHNDERFQGIIAKAAQNASAVTSSQLAFTIPEKDLALEGITYDKIGGDFYLGSMRKNEIIRIDRSGKTSVFKKPGEDSLLSVVGMQVDPLRRIIWVCSNVDPAMETYRKDQQIRGYVFRFDLEKGMLLGKYEPKDGYEHSFNDLTVITSTGDVFVTDNLGGGMFKIDYKNGNMEEFLPSGTFVGPNGITVTPDEKYLFVSSYGEGVYKVDLKTREYAMLTEPKGLSLAGIDGLYSYKGDLLAVQNGFNPERIVRFKLNKTMDSVTGADVIERNSPLLASPTTGVVVDNSFYYIGINGFSNMDRAAWQMKPDSEQVNLTVLKAAL